MSHSHFPYINISPDSFSQFHATRRWEIAHLSHLLGLLKVEAEKMADDYNSLDVFFTKVKARHGGRRTSGDQSKLSDFVLIVEIPGLKEQHPPVLTGDLVRLRLAWKGGQIAGDRAGTLAGKGAANQSGKAPAIELTLIVINVVSYVRLVLRPAPGALSNPHVAHAIAPLLRDGEALAHLRFVLNRVAIDSMQHTLGVALSLHARRTLALPCGVPLLPSAALSTAAAWASAETAATAALALPPPGGRAMWLERFDLLAHYAMVGDEAPSAVDSEHGRVYTEPLIASSVSLIVDHRKGGRHLSPLRRARQVKMPQTAQITNLVYRATLPARLTLRMCGCAAVGAQAHSTLTLHAASEGLHVGFATEWPLEGDLGRWGPSLAFFPATGKIRFEGEEEELLQDEGVLPRQVRSLCDRRDGRLSIAFSVNGRPFVTAWSFEPHEVPRPLREAPLYCFVCAPSLPLRVESHGASHEHATQIDAQADAIASSTSHSTSPLSKAATPPAILPSSGVAGELPPLHLPLGQLTPPRPRLDLLQSQLNAEQTSAVERIAHHSYGSVPYIVFGPPGTGKTMVVVESIVQVLLLTPSPRLLICAPSNGAVDVLAKRLVELSELIEARLDKVHPDPTPPPFHPEPLPSPPSSTPPSPPFSPPSQPPSHRYARAGGDGAARKRIGEAASEAASQAVCCA